MTATNKFKQKSSLIRQKGESQNGCFKKTKHTKFSEKPNISYPLIRTHTCAYQGVRNNRFFGKFDVICFLETPVFRFAFLPNYRPNNAFDFGKDVRKKKSSNSLVSILLLKINGITFYTLM